MYMFRKISIVLAATALAATTQAMSQESKGIPPAEKTAETDQERLQGTWVCVASVKDGKQVSDFVGVKVQFVGNRLTWFFPKKDGTATTQKGTFTIDPAKNPK